MGEKLSVCPLYFTRQTNILILNPIMTRYYITARLHNDRVFECETQREADVLRAELSRQGWKILGIEERERAKLPTIRLDLYVYGALGVAVETSENSEVHYYDSWKEMRQELRENGIAVPAYNEVRESLESEGAWIGRVAYDKEQDDRRIAA